MFLFDEDPNKSTGSFVFKRDSPPNKKIETSGGQEKHSFTNGLVKSTLYYNDGKTETKIYDFTKEAEQERYRSDLKKFGATDEQIIEVLNEILNQLKIQPTVKKNPIYTEFMGPLQTIEQQKQRKKEEEMNEQKTKAKEKAEKEESEKFA